MKHFNQLAKQFRDNEDGVLAVEFVLMVPLLIWALMSTWVYFDLYRAESISTRAALTIADAYSREKTALELEFIEGSQDLLELLAEASSTPSLRVTVIWYDEDNDSLELSFSKFQGPYYTEGLDESDLIALESRIPRMGDNVRAILLETRVPYEAPFSYSLGPFTGNTLEDVNFDTFTVIQPRFSNANYCYDPTYNFQDSGDEEC